MSIDVNNGEMYVITEGEVSVRQYDLSSSGTLATIQSNHHMPHEVHVVEGGQARKITKLNDDLVEGLNLARVERLKVRGWDRDDVESFVYYPTNHDPSVAYDHLCSSWWTR